MPYVFIRLHYMDSVIYEYLRKYVESRINIHFMDIPAPDAVLNTTSTPPPPPPSQINTPVTARQECPPECVVR